MRVTSMLELGGSRLGYTEVGVGRPVVWLHGSGPGATGMSNFGGNLAAFGEYRNIVLDLPGWGSSPRPETDEPLIFHAAEQVCRALTALGIERAHLVGNSYGGAVAMRVAMRHPERVDRLVLMAPGGVLPADAPPWPVGLDRLFAYMAAPEPSREAMAEFVRLMVFDETLATESLVDERYASSLRAHPELPIPPNFGDLTPDLGLVAAPTLLVWGREDQTVPLAWADRILAGIPDAELRVLPHCRHWVQYERAAEFNHIVREFLQGGAAAVAEG
ncbi:4,5:9,10-diseco-3-hydroxy-5,9,17-trioxoandrosta-1(10),2-diene-4-oate hydrolase [Actinacidiphila yanglinensis]|uniref:4,5:9,10-diseco-3-hydroxy-5,9,17-trioxoandrosta-1(10),2-diene-4-oate hydrolase n=1 Tax=Actinacidiphila yanglinensis TaxID=310779 RepID=A0A1H6E0Z7_9ACTN|nr:alpha/beta fold hydrolase [Actinacidiphila yanglinensis]SEG90615.1 4,5:9,10-diseco-3-hydroxy-5,9,17-trioxoandrosta-1(10),2-diene-4-oate hydrolase [Actinacidiphila yanglinensis]